MVKTLELIQVVLGGTQPKPLSCIVPNASIFRAEDTPSDYGGNFFQLPSRKNAIAFCTIRRSPLSIMKGPKTVVMACWRLMFSASCRVLWNR